MRLQTRARVTISRPRPEVFDLAVRDETIPAVFKGYGPVPATVSATTEGEPRAGATRIVKTADGARIVEEIRELERPRRHVYELVSGFEGVFAKMVRSGRGEWTFTDAADGGTAISWQFSFELRSALVLPVAAPVFVGFFRAAMKRALRNLAALAEREISP